MRRWRCYNEKCAEDALGRLGFDFESSAPICPKCGKDGRKPEFSQLIVKLEVLHYQHEDDGGAMFTKRGRFGLACDPKLKLNDRVRATTHLQSVTCPACKQAAAYTAAVLKLDPDEFHEDAKFQVEVDTLKQVISRPE